MMHLNLSILPQSRFEPLYVDGGMRQVVLMVAVGEYRNQPIVVGWGIGRCDGDGEIYATEICQHVVERVTALTDPETPLHILTLTKHRLVKSNLRRYLEQNRPRALIILCADSEIYDSVSPVLKPNWRMQ